MNAAIILWLVTATGLYISTLLAYDRVLENASGVVESPGKVLEFFVTKRVGSWEPCFHLQTDGVTTPSRALDSAAAAGFDASQASCGHQLFTLTVLTVQNLTSTVSWFQSLSGKKQTDMTDCRCPVANTSLISS